MSGTTVDPPSAESLSGVFRVEETRQDGDRVLYFGEPLVGPEALERRVWPLFRENGYQVSLRTVADSEEDPISGVELTQRRQALVAEPLSIGIDGVPWLNIATLVATIFTTLLAGTIWYYVDVDSPLDLLGGWAFAAAVLFVLGVHELGHYVASRYYKVDASLPYFIPIPSFIGTLGAVIRMKGRIPDRKALFDIGVAGPLAGLVAAVGVTVVGLYLPPVEVPAEILGDPQAIEIEFGYPLLLQLLAELTGQPLSYPDRLSLNPVVFAGWIGMFVTFLNLIPVGQLDGGHILRAVLGRRAETVGSLVPGLLFGLAGYLYFVEGLGLRDSVLIWGVWGVLTLGVSYAGTAEPIYDEPLDRKRVALAAVTFLLGALCFTPVPFRIVG